MGLIFALTHQRPFWRGSIGKRATINVNLRQCLVARPSTVDFALHLRVQVGIKLVLIVVVDLVEQVFVLQVEHLILEQRLVGLSVFYLLKGLFVLWLGV